MPRTGGHAGLFVLDDFSDEEEARPSPSPTPEVVASDAAASHAEVSASEQHTSHTSGRHWAVQA